MTNDETAFLPLQRTNDLEGALTQWSKFESPEDLLNYIKDHFAVDPARVTELQSITISDTQPGFDTIWMNNSGIPFIGIPVEGEFVRFYRYPPRVPFISVTPDDVIEPGLRAVTVEEIELWGLPELTGTAIWMILIP